MTPRNKFIAVAGGLILAVQAVASFTLHRDSFLPSPPPLMNFPLRLGDWAQIHDWTLEPEVLEMLSPDDTLTREYELSGSPRRASLFVAYYKTQLRAKQAHDPKVCLPGNGWNPVESRVIDVRTPASSSTFPANYYRIQKGRDEAVVLYWFQTHKAVYTFEQQLRAHRVLDAIVDNRTDMALVRVMVPVEEGAVEAADARALQFAQLAYPSMLPYFPKTGS